jgi:hypothetical protein
MSESTPLPRSVTEVAGETPEESVRQEREVVGDQPDVGDLVPPDDAQSSPADRP